MKLLMLNNEQPHDIHDSQCYSILPNIKIPEKYVIPYNKYHYGINKDVLKHDVDEIIRTIPFSVFILGFDHNKNSAIKRAEVTDFWHENQTIYNLSLYPSRYIELIEFIPNGLPVHREVETKHGTIMTLGDFYGHEINVTLSKDVYPDW